MDAIQFIKEHGADKAMEVVECAPEGATHLSDDACHYVNADFKPLPAHIKEQLPKLVDLSDIKRLVESVDIISKFDSVQEAQDAIANAPDGATEFRKLSCSTRYIKVGPRFFEYWDGSNWCRPTVPFTDETHILRFTELSKLKQAIADYESIYGGEHV